MAPRSHHRGDDVPVIIITNNTGEPYVVTRLMRSRQHDNPDNVVKIASRHVVNHGEQLEIQDFDPETCRFTITPEREASRKREYGVRLRSDDEHRELKR